MTTPENNLSQDPAYGLDPTILPSLILAVPNATTMSIGTGYVGETFDVGIALQSSRGLLTKNMPEAAVITSSKAVVSLGLKY
jgi:hypothetical protein